LIAHPNRARMSSVFHPLPLLDRKCFRFRTVTISMGHRSSAPPRGYQGGSVNTICISPTIAVATFASPLLTGSKVLGRFTDRGHFIFLRYRVARITLPLRMCMSTGNVARYVCISMDRRRVARAKSRSWRSHPTASISSRTTRSSVHFICAWYDTRVRGLAWQRAELCIGPTMD
jgi:hypothetical protein